MRFGIIGPVDKEIEPFIARMGVQRVEERAMLRFHVGSYAGVEVVAVMCGVCRVNAAVAAQILIDIFGVSHIAVTGSAGGVRGGLGIGDTVVATDTAYRDVNEGILTGFHPYLKDNYFACDSAVIDAARRACERGNFAQAVHFGRVVTGEAFVEGGEWTAIEERFGALAVDMETAGIAHVCHVNGVPFCAFRSISDNHEESGFNSFEKNLPVAAANSVHVLCATLEELTAV